MTKVVAMTIHDRTPDVINAIFRGFMLPGNAPDVLAVCFDRPTGYLVLQVKSLCDHYDIDLRQSVLSDNVDGPRCPSRAWNTALALVEEDHAFCISSDVVLAPHTLDMAYHLSGAAPKAVIVGRAEHCGQSYFFKHHKPGREEDEIVDRLMTVSWAPAPLGFLWLLPMAAVREIGGYDEGYMDGLCYEDSDFVLRMWGAGADFVFCDDMAGFHLEHNRDHLKDADGRVTINEKRFVEKHKDKDHLRLMKFGYVSCKFSVGMAAWLHTQDEKLIEDIERQQRDYNRAEQALPVVYVEEE